MTNLAQSSVAEVKRVCSCCKALLSPEWFYKKGERFDSQCKTCKRAGRRTDYEKQKQRLEREKFEVKKDEVKSMSPEANSEPQRPNRVHIEPGKEVSFELWEKLAKRTLTDVEKIEIKCNMTELFRLLIDEAKRQKVGPYGG